MAVSAKSVKTETVRALEKDLQERFDINSLKISINRGYSANIWIFVEDGFDMGKCEKIRVSITEDVF